MSQLQAQPPTEIQENDVLESARAVFTLESEAIARVGARLDERFERAVELLLNCQGRAVVTGIGKSGAIGRKMAATLASTGTPALFLHAAEGLHGDLGMVAPGDVLIALSYSGRTDELTQILPVVISMGVPVIALTGSTQSFVGARADVVLDISVEREACPLGLAPTTSTAAALAMGDALAVCVMQRRRFSHDDFARFHPGGSLGRGALLRVEDLMRTGERLALVDETATVRATLSAITRAGSGSAVVVEIGSKSTVLVGYVTDGDVRRRLLASEDAKAFLDSGVTEIMTRTPLQLSPPMPALDALRALQERGVDDAPVIGENGAPVGVLDVQELLRAGLL
jgi:arabinose-5-phosphate isomerase